VYSDLSSNYRISKFQIILFSGMYTRVLKPGATITEERVVRKLSRSPEKEKSPSDSKSSRQDHVIVNIANVQNPAKKIGVEVVKDRNRETKIVVAGPSPVNELVEIDQNLGRKVVEVDQSPWNEFQTGEIPTKSLRVSWSLNHIHH